MTLEELKNEWGKYKGENLHNLIRIACCYDNVNTWRKNHFKSYSYAQRNLLMKDVSSHMKKTVDYNVIYILEVKMKDKSLCYKIGVTSRSVKDRYTYKERKFIKVIKEDYLVGEDSALKIEKAIKRKLKGNEIRKNIFPLDSGHSETFKISKNKIIDIYNREIKNQNVNIKNKQLNIFF